MILEGLVIPISFNTGLLMEGIKAITGLVTGAVARTQEWAEGLDALGDVTGMSTDKLAAWSFVAKKAGVEIDTLSNATVIMAKGLLDSSGELSTTGKALQDFGVDVLDAGGKVRDQSDLMNDIAAKYAEFGTATERVDFLTNVFGKSGAGLVDVFDTLAKEGGIDAVKRKVESLGLVLDPDQYEDFQRNLSEVGLTFTGLSNVFTGPLLPGASDLLETFIGWLQSPWIANAITGVSEKLGILASDIATGIDTGNWDAFAKDFEEFTGINLQPLIDELTKFSDWVTNEGIPKWSEFVDNMKTGMSDFEENSKTETAAISAHWGDMLKSLSGLMNEVFGTNGIDLVVNWQQVGITALQLMDIFLINLSHSFEGWKMIVKEIKREFEILTDTVTFLIDSINTLNNMTYGAALGGASGYGGGGGNGNTSGGAAGGTWVDNRARELATLPTGSNVTNTQASANMGFDYYKLAAILAVEFAKARD